MSNFSLGDPNRHLKNIHVMARWGGVFWKVLTEKKRDDITRGLEAGIIKSKMTCLFTVFVVSNY